MDPKNLNNLPASALMPNQLQVLKENTIGRKHNIKISYYRYYECDKEIKRDNAITLNNNKFEIEVCRRHINTNRC